mmetsp:Transcript_36370/g.44880  ORF Transcript_36370/g.44880 Transcript_36370/m.44880 type:complete len:189 (+) Transcript_36370:164-730(+)
MLLLERLVPPSLFIPWGPRPQRVPAPLRDLRLSAQVGAQQRQAARQQAPPAAPPAAPPQPRQAPLPQLLQQHLAQENVWPGGRSVVDKTMMAQPVVRLDGFANTKTSGTPNASEATQQIHRPQPPHRPHQRRPLRPPVVDVQMPGNSAVVKIMMVQHAAYQATFAKSRISGIPSALQEKAPHDKNFWG